MIAIFKREIMNYLKRPLFWVGVLLVIMVCLMRQVHI